MTPLRVLLVGAGRAGANHARHLAHTARAAVAGVVDARAEAAEALAGRLGVAHHVSLPEAIEATRADAVVISTPTFTHHELALQAAEAGCHILCEKPMALTEAECEAMIAVAREAGVVLQIGFMRRFQPEFAEARRRIEEGRIGTPMVVKSLTRGPGLPPPWAWDLRRSNGMLAEVTSHDFDTVRWLAGAEIVRVYAEVANHKGAARGVEAGEFYDNAVVTLRLDSDAVATIDGTCPADYGYDARVEVVGTEGLLVIGDVRGTALVEVRDRDEGAITPVHRTWPERFETAYREQIRAFVDTAMSGGTPAVTGADGLAAVRAVRAANRSWQEGRPVTLEPVAA
jgi:myo-inositol 2-dehydrogenase/D-chiro-inositol 1-dehydrogenase/scyllo-inositol 2-dehydrogenase (NAD+)